MVNLGVIREMTKVRVAAGVAEGGGEFAWPLSELHDLWWNSLARAME